MLSKVQIACTIQSDTTISPCNLISIKFEKKNQNGNKESYRTLPIKKNYLLESINNKCQASFFMNHKSNILEIKLSTYASIFFYHGDTIHFIMKMSNHKVCISNVLPKIILNC